MKPAFLLALVLALAPHVPVQGAPAQGDVSPFARAVRLAERALETGDHEGARAQIQRALERDPKSIRVWGLRARWAEAIGDRDELVYALHRELDLMVAQGADRAAQRERRARLEEVDPIAADLLDLERTFIDRLQPLADKYEKDGRPHSAIRVHKEILALDPEREESRLAIERIAAAPDPSLAGDAKPKDLLADVSQGWIDEHDAAHDTWDERARLARENYTTHTDAGYEVLVRCAEAMEQMNAFYRQFFHYGTEEDGGNVSRIDLNIFKNRDEYLELGIGPPIEWSAGHFTGGAVETYIGAGGFEGTVGTLFHEAAHQFVSLATNSVGWLNEGLASFFEGCRILSNGTVLMNLPANHRLFPLVERMDRGWMADAWDGMSRDEPSESTPEKAPTFRIVLENRYPWGPAWYAPTWGVVYFLYNFEDPLDGRFIYREGFREFIDKSGGRMGEGAVENFEEVVLANPKKPTRGVDFGDNGGPMELPRTVEELDPVWKEWLTRLRDEQSGRIEASRPYLQWARYAVARSDHDDAFEHFEKGLVATPDEPDLLVEFADLLVDRYGNKDRATKLVLRALRALEAADGVDERRVTDLEKSLRKLDPKQKTLAKVHGELSAAVDGLVRRYLGADLNLMAMDLSWHMGTEFEMPGMFEYFEEAARRSEKSLALWKLAYDEESLDGWASIGNESYSARGEHIQAEFGEYVADAYDYQFLTLDTVTSGDFSMEAEIMAQRGKVAFAGLVFGRKSSTDFHAAILFPPGFDEDGGPLSGFLDLTSFYGSGSFDVWRHNPVAEKRAESRSVSEVWYELRIDVTGKLVDVWLDDEYVATQEFSSLDVLRGSFGLIVGPGEAKFRNVRYLARQPRDPGAWIERELRMESLGGGTTGAKGLSYLGSVPPWPEVKRWVQGERSSWEEAGNVPQLLVLWECSQNDAIRLDEWLGSLEAQYAGVGLRIVCIANTWDDEKVEAYLQEHPFPGAVAVDRLVEDAGTGDAFQSFFVSRHFLPRLLLLDVDQKVVWEGDPGFKVGMPWRPGDESYLDAPLADLVARRRLAELAAWRARWRSDATDALHRADLEGALEVLLESREFDWRIDRDVLEAQTRLGDLEAAIGGIDTTADAFAEAGREPALEVLVAWARLLEAPIDPKTAKALKKRLRGGQTSAWKRALGMLTPLRKKVEAGRDPDPVERVVEKLATLKGSFPETLLADLRAAASAGDAEGLRRTILEAKRRPALWLAREHFGW